MNNGTLATMDESDLPGPQVRITSRLIDSLYTEAMLLADEARSYFDDAGRGDRAILEPFARVGFACESLKVTTRIMPTSAESHPDRCRRTADRLRKRAYSSTMC